LPISEGQARQFYEKLEPDYYFPKRHDDINVLLVVDDDFLVAQTLSKILRPYFSCIILAKSEMEAKQALEKRITHIICDFDLGDGQRPGNELVNEWRDNYNLKKAIILTGDNVDDVERYAGIDSVISKPADSQKILDALCLEKQK
jgi:CheY-like chemotaxis protein